MNRITSYLLDLAKGIFNLKTINQYYHAKVSTRLDLLEFDMINKMNLYFLDLMNLEATKNKNSVMQEIR